MNNKYNSFVNYFGSSNILKNEPLSKYSSFRLGGDADLMIKVDTKEKLQKAVKKALELEIPFFIIGGATNLLVSDKGFRGLIIKNETGKIQFAGAKGGVKGGISGKSSFSRVYLEVDSGVNMNRLVRYALDQGLDGLQYFLGQPGSVGGAVYINAHNMWKRKFFGDIIVGGKIVNKQGELEDVSVRYFKFGYDTSSLQKNMEIVLSVVLELAVGNKNELWKEATEILEYRRKSQPTGVFSSGCTFRNIARSDAMRISTPNHTCSAGYLLDRVGLRGFEYNGVKFSDIHANFIVHKGGVKASDVLELIKLAKGKVKKSFGINLQEEIILVGDF